MKKIISIGIGLLLCSFVGFAFSAYDGFGLLDAVLLDQSAVETGHLSMSVTAGDGSYYFLEISNSTDQDITGRIVFADQVITDDAQANIACSFNDDVDSFSSSMSRDASEFSIPANSGIVRQIDLDYGYCFSGASMGCAILTESSNRDLGEIDVLLGDPSFVDIQVASDDVNCGKYTLMAIPSQRFGAFDLTGFLSYWVTDSRGSIGINNATSSGTMYLDDDGVSQFFYDFPSDGSGFMMLFKTNSYLSVGYTGIFDSTSTGSLDFTKHIALSSWIYSTGWFNRFDLSDLPAVQGFSGMRSLLVPGDLNNNDYIGAADLAIVNDELTVDFGLVDSDHDFDNDGYITSKDQAILVENVTRNGFWRYFSDNIGAGTTTGDDIEASVDQFPWN